MRQWLRDRFLLAAGLAILLAVAGCGGTATSPAPGGGTPGPRGEGPRDGMGGSPVRGIMMKIGGRGPDTLNRSLERELQAEKPAWDTIQPQTAEYAQLAADLEKLDAPRGSKESWVKLTAAHTATAAALNKAALAKDLAAAREAHQTLAGSCMECHREHRGGRGGGRGMVRGDGEGPGGPGPDGPGPRGPRGGFGRPPQPGQVLPPFVQENLQLTDEQKKQVQELQKEVDGKLEKILTEEQKQRLQEMRERGPEGFGPGRPGGFGPGGPGGRRGGA